MTARSVSSLARNLRRVAETASLATLSDQELLERFVTGKNRAALEALVRRRGQLVLSACRQVLSDPADIDDAFQATFLTLLLRADSIRKRESVGSWLFGTAHRIAVRARANARRRQRREADAAAARERSSGPPDLSWREAVGVLHEELNRLPDRFRLPLLLCYLQGRSRDEAAEQLGWAPGSLKGRLERGREALRKRLMRRGITLGAALLGALANSSAACALPPRLIQATLQAATAGPVPAAVAALTGGVSAVLGSKSKLTIALVLCLGLLTGIAARRAPAPLSASPPPDKPLPARESARPQPVQPRTEEGRGAGESAEKVTVHGKVLGPDGKPAAGAKLFVRTNGKAEQRATTGADGRFRLTVEQGDIEVGATLIATADDFGPDWTGLQAKAEGKELTLRLVKDDVPITGRVRDLEGRPMAGVRVRVCSLLASPDEDLTAWLRAIKETRHRNLHDGFLTRRLEFLTEGVPGLALEAITDREGRFRLAGIGRERAALLLIGGPKVEADLVFGLTRPGPRFQMPDSPGSEINWTVYGATIEHVSALPRPLTGTVRAGDTGKPLAGARIDIGLGPLLQATTDTNGTYRIDSLPALLAQLPRDRAVVDVLVIPPDDRPYLPAIRQLPFGEQRDLLSADFDLSRGVWVEGKVTDRVTGGPVQAFIEYFALRDNPHLKGAATLPTARGGPFDLCQTRPDGTFRIVAPPGPGLLAARCPDRSAFLPAKPLTKAEAARVLHPFFHSYAHNFHALALVDPTTDRKSVTCDLAFDPGRTVSGMIVGPDDKPVAGCHVHNIRPLDFWSKEALPGAEVRLTALHADRSRSVVVLHSEKKLVRALEVKGDEKSPLNVKLEPAGTVTGRLLDENDQPQGGAQLIVYFHKKDTGHVAHHYPARVTTDRDGRFRIEGMAPGLIYQLILAGKPPNEELGPVRTGLTVETGQEKNLGDVKVRPRRD